MAEFAASNTRTETVIADADGFVLESVGKIVLAFGHGSDKDTYTFSGSQVLDIVLYPDDFSIKAESDLSTVRGKMVSYGVFNDFQEFLL
jgi:hypothetical protein